MNVDSKRLHLKFLLNHEVIFLSTARYKPIRKMTRKIMVGDVPVGGGSPISIQSMTNTDTNDVPATISQIKRLNDAGCDIVRVAIPDLNAVNALSEIKKNVLLPIIADIHFDYRLAVGAVEAGADGLRINPGNIGEIKKIEHIVRAASDKGISIRVGVNSGSIPKDILAFYGSPTAEAIAKSAMREVGLINAIGFDNLKVSLKSSHVPTMIDAYRIVSQECDYPLHLGVTEAGSLIPGTVKNAVGIGMLLAEGIGDTLRVSLTRDPVEEVSVAWSILRALDIRTRGPEIISCPTCGRTEIDLFSLVEKVERGIADIKTPIKVAVMGCVVNGPGEAKEADIGIAGGRGKGILFKAGKVIRKIPEESLAEVLIAEVKLLAAEK